ncbi:uncharacterized protein LOC106675933 isoform X1 [Tachysurus ichikawai]
MLLKVKYHSIKKHIKLHSGFTYSEFIREAVEEDILLELLEANPDMCLTEHDSISDEEFSPLDHSTPSSLTDTISLSSSDSNLRELGIPTGRNRSSKEDTSSSATKASMSEAEKEELLLKDFLKMSNSCMSKN